MRSSIFKILLPCVLLLLGGVTFYAQEAGKAEGNGKIVVIYKGSKNSPAAPVLLDGQPKGELANETYVEIAANEGSHEVSVGKQSTHSFKCYIPSMSTGGSQCSAGGTPQDTTATFSPVVQKVDLKKGETSYLMVEPYKPELCCNDVSRTKMVDFKVREIKDKDADKLIKKFKAIQ
jgi:hypothetical protein